MTVAAGARTLRALALCALLFIGVTPAFEASGDWSDGRATFFGTDGWSIHRGSCGFGYIYPDMYPGYDVAAISDAAPEFAGSCGRCYEVRCFQAALKDGYGTAIDRTGEGTCLAGDKSVVVRTVDNCPCNYPDNAYSNRRWCCHDGGTTHFDLSIWAFEKLASTRLGVIPIQYRQVPCSARPADPAPPASQATPMYEQPPAGQPKPSADQLYVRRYDSVGFPQGASPLGADTCAVRPLNPSDPKDAQSGELVSFKDLYHGGLTSAEGGAPSDGAAASGNGCTDDPPSGQTCQDAKHKCSEDWLIAGNHCRATCGRCTLLSPSPSPNPSAPSGAGCTDQQPLDQTCEQAKQKCSEGWLISGGYCRATCGRCTPQGQGQATPSPSPGPSPSPEAPTAAAGCSDAGVPYQISYGTCARQKEWGKCGDASISGYCQATCGLCSSPAEPPPPPA